MYEYKYVHHKIVGFWGNSNYGHREIIDQHARDGWRYAGFIPVDFTGHGVIAAVDLVFERPVPETE